MNEFRNVPEANIMLNQGIYIKKNRPHNYFTSFLTPKELSLWVLKSILMHDRALGVPLSFSGKFFWSSWESMVFREQPQKQTLQPEAVGYRHGLWIKQQEPRNFWSSEPWSPVLDKSTDYQYWDFLKLNILNDSEWCVVPMLKLDSRAGRSRYRHSLWLWARGHCTASHLSYRPSKFINCPPLQF